jgi:hypothetical protein
MLEILHIFTESYLLLHGILCLFEFNSYWTP